MVQIKVVWDGDADRSVPLPKYETAYAAGADVRANLPGAEVIMKPRTRALIPTGLHVEIPQGYEIQVRPRSGLALKHGVMVLNAPGTIDSDYRGPLGVILMNTSDTDVFINHGMRIAQLVIAPVMQATFSCADVLGETARGQGGFGSTGFD